jgi:uncharacterized membrane protein
MRLIVKTATYGTMHMVIAFCVAYALTGNWQLALSISLVEPLVQTFAFIVHETLWEKKPVNILHATKAHLFH